LIDDFFPRGDRASEVLLKELNKIRKDMLYDERQGNDFDLAERFNRLPKAEIEELLKYRIGPRLRDDTSVVLRSSSDNPYSNKASLLNTFLTWCLVEHDKPNT